MLDKIWCDSILASNNTEHNASTHVNIGVHKMTTIKISDKGWCCTTPSYNVDIKTPVAPFTNMV